MDRLSLNLKKRELIEIIMQFFTEHAETFLYYKMYLLNLAPIQIKLKVHMPTNDHLCTIFWVSTRFVSFKKGFVNLTTWSYITMWWLSWIPK